MRIARCGCTAVVSFALQSWEAFIGRQHLLGNSDYSDDYVHNVKYAKVLTAVVTGGHAVMASEPLPLYDLVQPCMTCC